MADKQGTLCSNLNEREDRIVDDIIDTLCTVDQDAGVRIDNFNDAVEYAADEANLQFGGDMTIDKLVTELSDPTIGEGDPTQEWIGSDGPYVLDVAKYSSVQDPGTFAGASITLRLPDRGETVGEVAVECSTDLSQVDQQLESLQKVRGTRDQLC